MFKGEINKSLSVIIPAYCEVGNLRPAFESAMRSIRKAGLNDYEIIITLTYRPDGTNDGTPAVAAALASENPGIVSILDDGRYKGIGYRYRQGLQAAKKEFVIWVPGDNELIEDSLVNILKHLGKAEIVITYTANPEARAFKRRVVSRGFVLLCNLLFGLNVKYFNGHCILRRRLAVAAPKTTDSFAFMAEILIYLIKSGIKYIEVPMRIRPTTASASFKLKSVFECLSLLARLFWKIHFLRQRATNPTDL